MCHHLPYNCHLLTIKIGSSILAVLFCICCVLCHRKLDRSRYIFIHGKAAAHVDFVGFAAVNGLSHWASRPEHKPQSRNPPRGIACTPLWVQSTHWKVPKTSSEPGEVDEVLFTPQLVKCTPCTRERQFRAWTEDKVPTSSLSCHRPPAWLSPERRLSLPRGSL